MIADPQAESALQLSVIGTNLSSTPPPCFQLTRTLWKLRRRALQLEIGLVHLERQHRPHYSAIYVRIRQR